MHQSTKYRNPSFEVTVRASSIGLRCPSRQPERTESWVAFAACPRRSSGPHTVGSPPGCFGMPGWGGSDSR
ncbi:hypothetical protein B0T14DRAFT_283905 [Immersiella caudata]|uniref:Uncharacterized protein n=1 Tax=Immersiella caudata TaxID=314043 RepID=A0AA39WE60_9PEZI|nr:hypothetical protein B0T14DRAFT_283905 [Immersiella caudata]